MRAYYGQCPHCGKRTRLKADITMRKHYDPDQPEQVCPGWNERARRVRHETWQSWCSTDAVFPPEVTS